MRFRFDPLSRAFSNRCVFDENAQRISVDGRRKRIEMCSVFKRKRISLDGALVIRFERKLPGVLFCSSCGNQILLQGTSFVFLFLTTRDQVSRTL